MRWLIIATIAATLFFLALPMLDVSISRLFYTPQAGFFLAQHPLVRFVYKGVSYLTDVLYVTLIALFLVQLLKHHTGLPARRTLLFLIVVLGIGPGLLVHEVVKETFDRPRPNATDIFGGTQPYAPPLSIGADGKSFVSGHAAMGFYICAFAMLTHGRRRKYTYATGIAMGLGIGLVRIIQGGHYLSDVVFAGLLILWVIHGVHWAMYKKRWRA